MSAPAAIAVAKILIPETEKPKTMGSMTLEMEKKEANIIEATANGASTGVQLAIQLVDMLIAFVGLIWMIDGLLKYIGLTLVEF